MQHIKWFRSKSLQLAIYALAVVIAINVMLIYFLGGIVKIQNNITQISTCRPFIDGMQKNMTDITVLCKKLTTNCNTASINKLNQKITSLKLNFDARCQESSINTWQDMSTASVLDILVSFLRRWKNIAIQLNNLENGPLSTSDQSTTASLKNYLLPIQLSLLISLPVLIISGLALMRYRSRFLKLCHDIHESNQKYLFNSLEPINYNNSDAIGKSLASNLKSAAEFIQSISNGNYDVAWKGMTEENQSANNESIAGKLIMMREQMIQLKARDDARIWSTEGLAKFGDIIRKNQDSVEKLADLLIANIVKYLNAKVGGLFIVEENEETKSKTLNLKACYAYDRKKFITRQINIGDGIVGQTYLEGKVVYLKKIPDRYMQITSGLGEVSPKSLLVVPLRANDRIEGVLEIASLNEFKAHEIEFLEKLGEILASTIISVSINQKTQSLLRISLEQSEEMRAQEEEMRQNMEELEATQEQITRHMNELNSLKENLEKEKHLLDTLLNNSPDLIYFKEADGTFIRISKSLAQICGSENPMELIGKSDFDFFGEHAQRSFDDEQQIIASQEPIINKIELADTKDGQSSYLATTKMPFRDQKGNIIGIFGITRNVTEAKLAEFKIKEQMERLEVAEGELRSALKEIEPLKLEIQEIKKRNVELEKLIKEKENFIQELHKK